MIGLYRRGFALAGATAMLLGCGTFPLPQVYSLSAPPAAAPGVIDEAGLPHLELKTVTVPDDVDTTDLIRRTPSNQLMTSATGRWGERVSLGITHALAIDLAARLPHVVIESRGAYEPSWRLLVDVERFEISPQGRCILTARWRITTADGKVASNSDVGTFVVAAPSPTDAAASLAMTSAIDQLAEKIAVTVGEQPL